MVFFDYKMAKEMCTAHTPIVGMVETMAFWPSKTAPHGRCHEHKMGSKSCKRSSSKAQNAPSKDGTRGKEWGLPAFGPLGAPCKPSQCGPGGTHPCKQQDVPHICMHGKCRCKSYYHAPEETHGISQEIVSKNGCPSKTYGTATHSHGTKENDGPNSRQPSGTSPDRSLSRRWTMDQKMTTWSMLRRPTHDAQTATTTEARGLWS